MAYISALTPEKGERVMTFGGTRAGKSALQDMTMRNIQLARPIAMQVLVDSKPRYRAEAERGRFRKGRRNAAYRYESWEKSPVIPNSVVIDIWDEHPFKDIWNRPGEIAVMQSGEPEDWRRMLALLKGFVNAQIKGRERRIIVDECLDFTSGTLGVSTPRMTYSCVPLGRVANAELVSILGHTEFMACRPSCFTCFQESICFICVQIRTCGIYGILESKTQNHRKAIISSGNIQFNREAPSRHHSQESFPCLNGILVSYRKPNRREFR